MYSLVVVPVNVVINILAYKQEYLTHDKNGIKYNIIKTYQNGVRVGNVPDHKDKKKHSGIGQAWFPKNWTQKDLVAAGEHVIGLKTNSHAKDGTTLYGKWKGVQV